MDMMMMVAISSGGFLCWCCFIWSDGQVASKRLGLVCLLVHCTFPFQPTIRQVPNETNLSIAKEVEIPTPTRYLNQAAIR
jgi:hypothetical protein